MCNEETLTSRMEFWWQNHFSFLSRRFNLPVCPLSQLIVTQVLIYLWTRDFAFPLHALLVMPANKHLVRTSVIYIYGEKNETFSSHIRLINFDSFRQLEEETLALRNRVDVCFRRRIMAYMCCLISRPASDKIRAQIVQISREVPQTLFFIGWALLQGEYSDKKSISKHLSSSFLTQHKIKHEAVA